MKSNKTVVREADTTKSPINRIHKCQATFFGHAMRKEKQKYLVAKGMMEGKHSNGKQKRCWMD